METTTTQTALKWGAIAGIIGVIITLIGYLLKMEGNTVYGIISGSLTFLIIPATILFLALADFKKLNSGFISYSQGLGIGAMTGGITGLIAGIFGFIYLKFVDSSVMERIKEVQISKMEEQGLSSEQIDQSMQMVGKFMGPGMILVSSIIITIFVYFIISLIVSAIQKHEKPIFE